MISSAFPPLGVRRWAFGVFFLSGLVVFFVLAYSCALSALTWYHLSPAP